VRLVSKNAPRRGLVALSIGDAARPLACEILARPRKRIAQKMREANGAARPNWTWALAQALLLFPCGKCDPRCLE